MVIAPFIRADAPTPATARPMISMADVCAAPHSAEPNSKMAKNPMKDHCVPECQLVGLCGPLLGSVYGPCEPSN